MSGIMQMLIGRKLTPDEQVRKWRTTIRAQERELDKQIRGIQTEEMKVRRSLKQAATRSDTATAKLLAKEIVRGRKTVTRLHTSKAQLNSMILQLQQQLATMKVAGSLQKSTEIMKIVNGLIKLPEISSVMQSMAQEMMKAGIIDEMIQDTIELGDDEELEDEADEEVDKVLLELTNGRLGTAGPVGAPLEDEKEEEVEPQTQMEDMEKRLQALKAI
ncbi:Charged multivesicular body protein 3 [Quaeritorhiza haematococci]|nr:Charged multivesicular body protein 3 [Quaeritorhiza haematococci]